MMYQTCINSEGNSH